MCVARVCKTGLMWTLLLSGFVFAQDAGFEDVEGPNVRVIRHADGSRTRFTRTPDNTVLTKKKFSPNGVMAMVTVYGMFKRDHMLAGNPNSCMIYDGKNNLLFWVRYGYRKQDGQLVQEEMFDARAKRIDPKTGEEAPVQVVKYLVDEHGNRSAPYVINTKFAKGGDIKAFEKRFGVRKSTMYESNPFAEDEE